MSDRTALNISSGSKDSPSRETSTFASALAFQIFGNERRNDTPFAVNGAEADNTADVPHSSVLTFVNDADSAGGVGNASTAMSS